MKFYVFYFTVEILQHAVPAIKSMVNFARTMNKVAVLSVAYLPPALYFQKILSYDMILIEGAEHFVKQTFRNRCSIYGANGKLDLTIPLVHSSERTSILNKKISHSEQWQKLHWKSLQSAYRSAPYFEFFEQEFEYFYSAEFENLFYFNLELIKLVCRLLKMNFSYEITKEWRREYAAADDFRLSISPKSKIFLSNSFPVNPYYQVFSSKFGFIPNLSVVDVLFHEGLNAIDVLRGETHKW